jgi:hypothetical protein
MQSNRHARVCVRSVAEPRRPLLRDIYEHPTFVPEATGRLEKWEVAKLCQTKIGTPVLSTLDQKEMFHFQNRISVWRIKSEYNTWKEASEWENESPSADSTSLDVACWRTPQVPSIVLQPAAF